MLCACMCLCMYVESQPFGPFAYQTIRVQDPRCSHAVARTAREGGVHVERRPVLGRGSHRNPADPPAVITCAIEVKTNTLEPMCIIVHLCATYLSLWDVQKIDENRTCGMIWYHAIDTVLILCILLKILCHEMLQDASHFLRGTARLYTGD